MPQDILNIGSAQNFFNTSAGGATIFAGVNCTFFNQTTSADGAPAWLDVLIPAYGRNMLNQDHGVLFVAPNVIGGATNFYIVCSYIDINGNIFDSGVQNIGPSGGFIYTAYPTNTNGFRSDWIVGMRIQWVSSSSINGWHIANGSGGQIANAHFFYNVIQCTQPLINPPAGGYLNPIAITISTTDPADAPFTTIASQDLAIAGSYIETPQHPSIQNASYVLQPGFHEIQAFLFTRNTNPYDNNNLVLNQSVTPDQKYWIGVTLSPPINSLPAGWYIAPPAYAVSNPNNYIPSQNILTVLMDGVPTVPSALVANGVHTITAKCDCPGFYTSPTISATYYIGQRLNAPSISVIGQPASSSGYYSGAVTIQITDNNPNHPNPSLTITDNGVVIASTNARSFQTTLSYGNHSINAYSSGSGAYTSFTTSAPFRIGRRVKIWNGAIWVEHPIMTWNGSIWTTRSAKVYNTTTKQWY